MQKEPKLARARQIPEWSEYDSEIARFARTLAEKGLVHSDAAAVDIDSLASVGGGKKADSSTETADSTDAGEATEATSAEAGKTAAPEHPRDEL